MISVCHRSVLGLAFEDRRILVAEVAGRQKLSLRGAAEFCVPQEISLEDPEALGRSLGSFLRYHRLNTRSAVLGLPARWLVTREKRFPPAGDTALAGMVRIEAERAFASELPHLVVDYVRRPARSGSRGRVLIAAVPRLTVERLLAVARAANLKPLAITASSIVLGGLLRPRVPSLALLSIRPSHAELVVRLGGCVEILRHLGALTGGGVGASPEDIGRLASAARLQMMALSGAEEKQVAPEAFVIWNGTGMDSGRFHILAGALGANAMDEVGLADLGLLPAGVSTDAERGCLAAVALAVAGLRVNGYPLDFLHSGLEVRQRRLNARRLALAAVGVVAVAGALGAFLETLHAEAREVALLRDRLNDMRPEIDAARVSVERAEMLRSWTDRRPRFLDVLLELTLACPADRPIWITNVAVREDMRVVASGKSSDERAVLEFLDKIRARPAFGDVQLLYMRDAGGASHDVAFSVRFNFTHRE